MHDGKCDQIPSFLRIWSHLLKKFLMQNFIFCGMNSVESVRFHKISTPGHKMKFR